MCQGRRCHLGVVVPHRDLHLALAAACEAVEQRGASGTLWPRGARVVLLLGSVVVVVVVARLISADLGSSPGPPAPRPASSSPRPAGALCFTARPPSPRADFIAPASRVASVSWGAWRGGCDLGRTQ